VSCIVSLPLTYKVVIVTYFGVVLVKGARVGPLSSLQSQSC
jgi:hypothetical protein